MLDASRAQALSKLYPNHSLVMTSDFRIDFLSLPSVTAIPMPKTQLITNAFFHPVARRIADGSGVLVESVEFGAFGLAWSVCECYR